MSIWLLIVLLLIGIYIYYFYLTTCECFKNLNYQGDFINPTEGTEYLKNLEEFNYYIRNTPKEQYSFISDGLLNENNTEEEYRKFYLSQLRPWLTIEISKINKGLIQLYKETDYYKRTWDTPWRFIKFSDKLEGGMPFTLGNVIMMPEKIINREIDEEYLETLLHEKMHILQKENKDLWYQYIYQKLPWIKKLENLPKGFKENYLFNPDGVDIGWKYIINGKEYIPYLKWKGGVSPGIYNREMDEDFREKMPVNNSWYHPMELTATVLSKYPFNEMDSKIKKYFEMFKEIV